jgi:tetrapyrrole methylase family protein/MazG family protein
MESFEKLVEVVARLRGEGGCPWDREQTHATLKATCIEEAAEVVCGINILEKTGNASNLCEELGDLLLQVVMQAQIAQEEGLFTIEDVTKAITEKMIRRHPHVFGEVTVSDSGEVLKNWEEIKKLEKKGKIDDDPYIDDAFDESVALIERARKRKAQKRERSQK